MANPDSLKPFQKRMMIPDARGTEDLRSCHR
jgi:hypothetical protein